MTCLVILGVDEEDLVLKSCEKSLKMEIEAAVVQTSALSISIENDLSTSRVRLLSPIEIAPGLGGRVGVHLQA